MIVYDGKSKNYFYNMFSKIGKRTNEIFLPFSNYKVNDENDLKNSLKNKYDNLLFNVINNFDKNLKIKNHKLLKVKTKFEKKNKKKILIKKKDNSIEDMNDKKLYKSYDNNIIKGYTFRKEKFNKRIIKDKKDFINPKIINKKIKGSINFCNKTKRSKFVNYSHDLNYDIKIEKKNNFQKFNSTKRKNYFLKKSKFEVNDYKIFYSKKNTINFNKSLNFNRLDNFKKSINENFIDIKIDNKVRKTIDFSKNIKKLYNKNVPSFLNKNKNENEKIEIKACKRFKNKKKIKIIKKIDHEISIDFN